VENGKPEIVQQIFDLDSWIPEPTGRSLARLERWVECINGEEKARLLRVLRSMVMIGPKPHKTARSLLNEPWLMNQALLSQEVLGGNIYFIEF